MDGEPEDHVEPFDDDDDSDGWSEPPEDEDGPPDDGGVREPRGPKPTLPAAAAALPEPHLP